MDASTTDTYLQVTESMGALPPWLQHAVALSGEVGLIALALLLALTGWRSWRDGSPRTAALLAGGAGTVIAYAASELLKVAQAQPRPCRTLDVATLVPCPAPGDFSLPSNHATIAAGLAAAVVLGRPRLALVGVALAALVAGSRVAVGVHYPHDVTTGALLGATVAVATALILARPLRRLLAGRRGEVGWT